jgi:hypothetical protein
MYVSWCVTKVIVIYKGKHDRHCVCMILFIYFFTAFVALFCFFLCQLSSPVFFLDVGVLCCDTSDVFFFCCTSTNDSGMYYRMYMSPTPKSCTCDDIYTL